MEKKAVKKVVKINGKKVGEINERNLLHFEIQRKMHTQIVKSKKIYNRARDKKVHIE